jgi:hypothetical protein
MIKTRTVEEQRLRAASLRRHRRRHRELIRAASVASSLAAIAALSACEHGNSTGNSTGNSAGYAPLPKPTGTEQVVAANNFGRLWPVTVPSGTIGCRADDAAVFIAPGGKAYALNERAREHGYADVSEIRAEDVSLGALRSDALRLCR